MLHCPNLILDLKSDALPIDLRAGLIQLEYKLQCPIIHPYNTKHSNIHVYNRITQGRILLIYEGFLT
jgi:hypothetical protein